MPVLVPFAPRMPEIGIDGSWALALNEAVAQHLAFGRDIIFTLGPYAAIYTKMYHPQTDGLMLVGSTYLALTYAYLLLFIWQQTNNRGLWLFIGYFCAMIYVRDVLFYTYPLLLAFLLSMQMQQKNSFTTLQSAILSAPFGLLVLIKSSLIPFCFVFIFLNWVLFRIILKQKNAWILLVSPAMSLIFWWLVAGQPLMTLLPFIISSLDLVIAFTPTMSMDGDSSEVLIFLMSALLIVGGILFAPNINKIPKTYLGTVFGLFLFLAFKTGFVRHNHALIAGSALGVASLLFFMLNTQSSRWIIFALSALSSLYITHHYRAINLGNQIITTYQSAFHGLITRLTNNESLPRNYSLIMNWYKDKSGLPQFNAPVDIYSNGQTELLASGNHWQPRPIFQSYSAFSQKLTAVNAHYLASEKSATNLIFRIEPIDNRLPALEDGASWPILLRNFQLVNENKATLYLKKKSSSKFLSQLYSVQTIKLGDSVQLPVQEELLWAEIVLKPSFLGALSGWLYKQPSVEIRYHLQDGRKQNFHFPALLGRSRFLLSPLIEDTHEFAQLYAQNRFLTLKNNYVTSMKILPQPGGGWAWQAEYQLNLYKII